MSERGFLEIFSVQRGTPRESDTASRREEACLLNLCYVVAQLDTSQPVAVDTTTTHVIHRRLGTKSDIVKTARIIHSAQRTFARFAWFPTLALLTFGELVSTCTISCETRGKIICCRLRSVDAHDQQKGFEVR